MKFSSEDLMKAMGLSVGDRVRVNDEQLMTVVLNDCGEIKLIEDYIKIIFPIEHLLNRNVEILPRPKRVGDLKCNGRCPICPCIYVCNDEVNVIDKTLYEVLELGISTFTKTPEKMNEAIHNIIKARLDKEVE